MLSFSDCYISITLSSLPLRFSMLAARCTQRDRIIEQDVRSRIADVDVIFTIRDCPALRAAVPVSQRMAGAAGVDRHLDLPLLARVEPYLLEADETLRRLVEGCGQTDVDLRNFGAYFLPVFSTKNCTSSGRVPSETFGVTSSFEIAKVVYDRPCPKGKSGLTLLASYQRYPIRNLSV